MISLNIGQAQANHVYYLRCIKPNPDKTLSKFDPLFVLKQMRAMGMMETIRVRKMGYSLRFNFFSFRLFYINCALRLPFAQFVERYRIIMINSNGDPKAVCTQFLTTLSYLRTFSSLYSFLIFTGTSSPSVSKVVANGKYKNISKRQTGKQVR